MQNPGKLNGKYQTMQNPGKFKFMDFNPFREGLKLYTHPPVWI